MAQVIFPFIQFLMVCALLYGSYRVAVWMHYRP